MRVKPVLVYDTPERRDRTSWRAWGGIQTQDAARAEVDRIQSELQTLRKRADFPLEFRPVAAVRSAGELASLADLVDADTVLVYAAGGWMDIFEPLHKLGKPLIFFCRHKSGPVYLWYEIISPRYLRQHTDTLALTGIDEDDVVIDSQDELLWRMRALCGLVNTVGTRILAVGGPSAWAQPAGVVPKLVEEKWKFDIRTVSYDELGKLITAARADVKSVQCAQQRGEEYLKAPGNTLETPRPFVHNAFLLDDIFRRILHEADCRAITINDCMSTIMPLAETTACLTLSTLNDAGYLAFCESDFVLIPAGVLLANIAGRPVFMNDPTYPHDGLITLAHCTAPRRMDGQKLEPARILTHFESDYGAAPKVEMAKGQVVTNIVPDFKLERWVGLRGEIVDAPFLDICRSQIDVRFTCDSLKLAQRMPGFHWITAYGNYLREVGYALKRIPIAWEPLA
ncbi:MAG: sugar isomerase [Planctomycetes bacterium]|nr:sugar isomerase [Planctomycetota bacterium]